MAAYISAGVRARWPGKTVWQRRISSASVKMGSGIGLSLYTAGAAEGIERR
jgi:hypothetical protein